MINPKEQPKPNFYHLYKQFPHYQDGEYEDEHFNRFIKSQIIEKLIEDAEEYADRFDIMSRIDLKIFSQHLRNMWL